MKKITRPAIIPILCLFLSPACSKKSSPTPCKLIEIVDAQGPGATTYDLRYNSGGQIATIMATGTNGDTLYTKTFTYSTNLIMTSMIAPAGTTTDSVVLNSAGLITYSLTKAPGSNSTIDTYTENSSGQLVSSTDQVNGGAITTTTYTFAGGDLVSSFDGSVTTTYSYYTDKSFADGDPLKVAQLLATGGLYIKNEHLLKSIEIGGATESFAYTFDSDGKITGITKTSGSPIETFSDQYDCA